MSLNQYLRFYMTKKTPIKLYTCTCGNDSMTGIITPTLGEFELYLGEFEL